MRRLRQHRTIPALRLKHRSGGCGTASALPKYTLTIEEASKYFRIGENKLRRLAEENKDAGWLIMNGNRIQIKRRQFEKVIDKLDAI